MSHHPGERDFSWQLKAIESDFFDFFYPVALCRGQRRLAIAGRGRLESTFPNMTFRRSWPIDRFRTVAAKFTASQDAHLREVGHRC